jgi:Rrf2 family transcriptional regulator, cysteine metabolism repressor
MRLTVKSEYACLALIYLARKQALGRVTSIADIAQTQKIPKKYLEQILLTLKRSGYVRSVRGAHGGYLLAKKPGAITLAEIIRLLDGPLAPVESASRYFYRKTPVEKSKKLIGVFREIRDIVARRLEQTTFADLA